MPGTMLRAFLFRRLPEIPIRNRDEAIIPASPHLFKAARQISSGTARSDRAVPEAAADLLQRKNGLAAAVVRVNVVGEKAGL